MTLMKTLKAAIATAIMALGVAGATAAGTIEALLVGCIVIGLAAVYLGKLLGIEE